MRIVASCSAVQRSLAHLIVFCQSSTNRVHVLHLSLLGGAEEVLPTSWLAEGAGHVQRLGLWKNIARGFLFGGPSKTNGRPPLRFHVCLHNSIPEHKRLQSGGVSGMLDKSTK